MKNMVNNKKMGKWLEDFNLSHPLVIAGPCSAETEEQVLKIAHELKNSDVSIFRAGIWKPRTRPGGFEGVGEIGLKWMQRAKAETGLLMAIEVANAAHVKLALEHDIDVLWIGARTTVNTFAVQEIADALTYVRSSWGNSAGAVTPDEVKSVRDKTTGRAGAYEEAELQQAL
jgi:chorismate mutase